MTLTNTVLTLASRYVLYPIPQNSGILLGFISEKRYNLCTGSSSSFYSLIKVRQRLFSFYCIIHSHQWPPTSTIHILASNNFPYTTVVFHLCCCFVLFYTEKLSFLIENCAGMAQFQQDLWRTSLPPQQAHHFPLKAELLKCSHCKAQPRLAAKTASQWLNYNSSGL